MTSHRTLLVGISALSLCLACAGAKVGIDPGNGGTQSGGGGNVGGGVSGAGGLVFDFDAAPNITPPDTRKADLPPDTFPFKIDDAGNAI